MGVRSDVLVAALYRLDGDRPDVSRPGVDGVGHDALGGTPIRVLGGEEPDPVGVLDREEHVAPLRSRRHRLRARTRVRVGEPDIGKRSRVGPRNTPPATSARLPREGRSAASCDNPVWVTSRTHELLSDDCPSTQLEQEVPEDRLGRASRNDCHLHARCMQVGPVHGGKEGDADSVADRPRRTPVCAPTASPAATSAAAAMSPCGRQARLALRLTNEKIGMGDSILPNSVLDCASVRECHPRRRATAGCHSPRSSARASAECGGIRRS